MRTHRLRTPMRVAFPLLVALSLGCNENIVTPCFDCGVGAVIDVTTETFAISEGAEVRIENFTGRIVWRTGETGIVRVTATRRANNRYDGESLEVEMRPHPGGLVITTRNPHNARNASVELEVIAHTGVRPNLATGVGNIDYKGRPAGRNHFSSGVGSIRLRLPADVGVQVDLQAAVGSIYNDFPLEERVWSPTGSQCGRIGSGAEGTLTVRAAVGNIYLLSE